MEQAVRRPDWAPESIDIERPSVARMYDYFLGGSNNFAVDRETARQVIAAVPDAPLQAQSNRAFLRRVMRFLLDAGVRRFLDIGSGIPSPGSVHEIAQANAPDTRVVYVDVDPIAVMHGQSILDGNPLATAIQGDLCAPERILSHPRVRQLMSLDEPVAVLLIAVLHYVPEAADPAGVIARIRAALPSGSYLALSVLTGQERGAEEVAAGSAVYQRADTPIYVRDTTAVLRMFEGFTVVPPGVVAAPSWRPDPAQLAMEETGRPVFVGGVGRVR
jgi:hypothetical protein